jgi:Alpha/beta hydrolase domain
MIYSISIDRTESPTFEGEAFSDVGPYEKLVGRAVGAVDPAALGNAKITDIELAPKDGRNLVHYETAFYVLKPVDMDRGNGVLLYDVCNRGNKTMYRPLNLPFQVGDEYPPINDPATVDDAGTGYLMREGYTIAWCGWDATVLPGNGRLTFHTPVALREGLPVVGPALEELALPGGLVQHQDIWQLTYPAATLDQTAAHLTRRCYRGDRPTPVRPDAWRYVDASTIALRGAAKFEAGIIYELVYPASAAKIVGLGFAAVRDFASFLRYGAGVPSPLGTSARWVISSGLSQAARFYRPFLRMGMNRDERRRRVFDGLLSYIAGAGGGFFNYRFAQPNRTRFNRISWNYPEQTFPFSFAVQTDPITGTSDGALLDAETTGTAPKIIEINDSNSYWFKLASLTTTSPDGLTDLPDHPLVRSYLLSSIAHAVGRGRGDCTHARNAATPGPALRALLKALREWVTFATEPPPSQVPRIDAGTLVPPLPQTDVGFPHIPGVPYTGIAASAEIYDYGPEFERGVLTKLPPSPTGNLYTALVPKVDRDGQDAAGIRLPDVQAPLGTHTGWNANRGAPRDECGPYGSFIPFAATRAERTASADPRLSLEERYGTRRAYARAVQLAAERLVQARFLLAEDEDAYVSGAARADLRLPA